MGKCSRNRQQSLFFNLSGTTQKQRQKQRDVIAILNAALRKIKRCYSLCLSAVDSLHHLLKQDKFHNQ